MYSKELQLLYNLFEEHGDLAESTALGELLQWTKDRQDRCPQGLLSKIAFMRLNDINLQVQAVSIRTAEKQYNKQLQNLQKALQ